MADLDVKTTVQPVIAQMECQFKNTPFKGMAVDTFDDLLTLNVDYNYKHKKVWVRDEKTDYYLNAGDGSISTNWKRTITRAVINRYSSDETYQIGEVVYLSGKIFNALQIVPKNVSPLTNGDYWDVISGETLTYRYLFTNASTVIIYTAIKNPQFEVILGDICYSDDEEPVALLDVDGMYLLENKEIVDVPITRRTDVEDDEGYAYEISFYENEELTEQLSGCINIK